MPVSLYMDQHIARSITDGLRLREVEVLTAHEDGASQFEDDQLLTRASELQRILFTRDDDLLAEAHNRQTESVPFAGVIYAHQLKVPIGTCIRDLEIIAKASEPDDLRNQVTFLPL